MNNLLLPINQLGFSQFIIAGIICTIVLFLFVIVLELLISLYDKDDYKFNSQDLKNEIN